MGTAAGGDAFGVDYAWGRPGVAALKKAGVRFVCRYLSYDTTGKNLTRAEAGQLSGAGLWLVVVWETTASRALSGAAGGALDAKAARVQAAACGMPADRPIYFAVDWDADAGDQAAINAYLDGAASVLGRARVGLYGGYGPIKRAFDAKKITFGWQTYAWSGGRWDGRAQLQQYSNDQIINGVGLDYDRATAADYGQWRPGEGPDMPLTDDDIARVAEAVRVAVLTSDKVPAPAGTDPKNRTWQFQNLARETYSSLQQVKAAVVELARQGGDVDEEAVARAVLAVLTPEAIAGALPDNIAQQVLDGLKVRLET